MKSLEKLPEINNNLEIKQICENEQIIGNFKTNIPNIDKLKVKDGIIWLHNETEGICSTCNYFKNLFYAYVLEKSDKILTIECEDCFSEHY